MKPSKKTYVLVEMDATTVGGAGAVLSALNGWNKGTLEGHVRTVDVTHLPDVGWGELMPEVWQ